MIFRYVDYCYLPKMYLRLIITSLLLCSPLISAVAQRETYSIKLTDFSTAGYDEFCPVYYKNGIVFCSNRSSNTLIRYSDSANISPFKIYYVDTTKNISRGKPILLSKSLTTKYNDGPVTFSRNGDTIYYSRNLKVEGKLRENNNLKNKLGIFSSTFARGKWTKSREFRFNNEWYNITTPCLSPDGTRLFFASDKSGGFGGSDLYYCQWKGDYWGDPVNLGQEINTTGNEAYPFINSSDELFFSSDGHHGLGGKDLFVSIFSGNRWHPPVHLDPPINSQFDDFGLIADSVMSEGYFSSNRNKSVDIFHFRTNVPQVFYSDLQKENNYCYLFSDSGSIAIDTAYVRFVWDFGDGVKATGAVGRHCFKGPGTYTVRLDLIDKATGYLFFSKLVYKLILIDYVQAYINSPEVAVKGESVMFDGLRSWLPGYKILDYTWDFGDGVKLQGATARHSFKDAGEFKVNMGLTIRSDESGKIQKTGSSKKILVVENNSQKSAYQSARSNDKSLITHTEKNENIRIIPLFSAESEFQNIAIFGIELLSSKIKLGINNRLFSNLHGVYRISEIYDKKEGVYRYVADEQINLMSTYYSYRQIGSSGFKGARIIIEPLEDPAARELNSLLRLFGTSADKYFDGGRLSSFSYLVLDQLVNIMNKYPDIKLEIAVHTDNAGLPDVKLKESLQYARIIEAYLINKRIANNRLVVKGLGEAFPVANNYSEKERSLNRRIDFVILK